MELIRSRVEVEDRRLDDESPVVVVPVYDVPVYVELEPDVDVRLVDLVMSVTSVVLVVADVPLVTLTRESRLLKTGLGVDGASGWP
jgi:hypothetical protein